MVVFAEKVSVQPTKGEVTVK